MLFDPPDATGRHRSYDQLVGRARSLEVDGIPVRAAALEDLIASKEWGESPQGSRGATGASYHPRRLDTTAEPDRA